MEQRVVTQAGDRLERTFGRGMPPWAAESFRLGSSVGLEVSTEALPAPSAFPG